MKKEILLIAILLLVIPVVSAVEISIKTLADHRISVIIRNAGEPTGLDSYHQNTGDGNVAISSPVDIESIDLLLILKKDGAKILDKKFESLTTDKIIKINFVPGNVGLVEAVETENKIQETNITSNASVTGNETGETGQVEQTGQATTNEAVTKEGESKPGITSKAVENIKSILTSKTTYYIMGVIVVIVVLFFIIFFVRRKVYDYYGGWVGEGKDNRGKIKVTKFSSAYDRELSSAERKLHDAQKELEALKDRRNALQEARDRLKRDERELRRLEE